ncbi:hypothetical protein PR048_009558 [Dryococelus australis]|uniref:Uncharacterized protein n=1 Tax=Dryococelus australis TaxID=614101 RepID=A0ABQ9I085_9NEOP|nr:hypothetical protein PR048_009558 [Dryococelus australis]
MPTASGKPHQIRSRPFLLPTPQQTPSTSPFCLCYSLVTPSPLPRYHFRFPFQLDPSPRLHHHQRLHHHDSSGSCSLPFSWHLSQHLRHLLPHLRHPHSHLYLPHLSNVTTYILHPLTHIFFCWLHFIHHLPLPVTRNQVLATARIPHFHSVLATNTDCFEQSCACHLTNLLIRQLANPVSFTSYPFHAALETRSRGRIGRRGPYPAPEPVTMARAKANIALLPPIVRFLRPPRHPFTFSPSWRTYTHHHSSAYTFSPPHACLKYKGRQPTLDKAILDLALHRSSPTWRVSMVFVWLPISSVCRGLPGRPHGPVCRPRSHHCRSYWSLPPAPMTSPKAASAAMTIDVCFPPIGDNAPEPAASEIDSPRAIMRNGVGQFHTRRLTSDVSDTLRSLLPCISAGMKGRGKREIPEKTSRPAASSVMSPICENPELSTNKLLVSPLKVPYIGTACTAQREHNARHFQSFVRSSDGALDARRSVALIALFTSSETRKWLQLRRLPYVASAVPVSGITQQLTSQRSFSVVPAGLSSVTTLPSTLYCKARQTPLVRLDIITPPSPLILPLSGRQLGILLRGGNETLSPCVDLPLQLRHLLDGSLLHNRRLVVAWLLVLVVFESRKRSLIGWCYKFKILQLATKATTTNNTSFNHQQKIVLSHMWAIHGKILSCMWHSKTVLAFLLIIFLSSSPPSFTLKGFTSSSAMEPHAWKTVRRAHRKLKPETTVVDHPSMCRSFKAKVEGQGHQYLTWMTRYTLADLAKAGRVGSLVDPPSIEPRTFYLYARKRQSSQQRKLCLACALHFHSQNFVVCLVAGSRHTVAVTALGRGDSAARTLASHHGNLVRFPAVVVPGFSHGRIAVPNDVVRLVLLGNLPSPLLHSGAAPCSLSLKTPMLTAVQISSLHSFRFEFLMEEYRLFTKPSKLLEEAGTRKESSMACDKEMSQHSAERISGNLGKPKSRWLVQESNSGPPEGESRGLPLRHLDIGYSRLPATPSLLGTVAVADIPSVGLFSRRSSSIAWNSATHSLNNSRSGGQSNNLYSAGLDRESSTYPESCG